MATPLGLDKRWGRSECKVFEGGQERPPLLPHEGVVHMSNLSQSGTAGHVAPPPDLPAPADDGAASHLTGETIPPVRRPSTDGGLVDVADLASGSLVLYLFPRMGAPDVADPPGWMETPGAYGCTQQSCSFRDLHGRFGELGYQVAGVSAQPSAEQQEAVGRLGLTFPLLADPDRRLGDALRLPTFDIAGSTLYKRLTLVARQGRIVKVFYPVFPPVENAAEVLDWIAGGDQAG